jgi:hypothetical protein
VCCVQVEKQRACLEVLASLAATTVNQKNVVVPPGLADTVTLMHSKCCMDPVLCVIKNTFMDAQ